LKEQFIPKTFVPPLFLWESSAAIQSDWKIIIQTPIDKFSFKSKNNTWHIPFTEWEKIRDNSIDKPIIAVISGKTRQGVILTGKVTFSISQHSVEGNILYRHFPVPHGFQLSHYHLTRYKLVNLSNNNSPKTIIQPSDDKINSCLGCHSVSQDGKKLVLISKVAYDAQRSPILSPLKKESLIIVNADSKINFPQQEDILSYKTISSLFVTDPMFNFPGGFTEPRISPDGRHVAIIVNVKSAGYYAINTIKRPFSINPLTSNIGIYSIIEKRLWMLSGAHRPGYIHSTPMWSADGKFITYAFAKRPAESKTEPTDLYFIELDPKKHYFMPEGMEFDLYTIPFNNGKGGTPKVIKATQNNGFFDYFPEYSPNGKWIVYTSSKYGTNVFLNPDSTLYIVSAEGDGTAKKLSSNFKGVMNSWHKFSLDGNWLLFKARPDGTNTEFFLTHIDASGNDTPPILIDGLTKNDLYRANIPVFTNLDPETVIKFPSDGYCNAHKYTYEKEILTCVLCHSYNPDIK